MTVACGLCSGFGRSIIRHRRSGRGAWLVGEQAAAKERGLVARSMLTHSDPQRLAELAQAAHAERVVA